MAKKATDIVGWILGALLSVATFAQAMSSPLACDLLPFTYQTQTACKVLEKMNLRPFHVAAIR